MKLASWMASAVFMALSMSHHAMAVAMPKALANADPAIVDFHKTSLDLYAAGKLHEHGRFAVKVSRFDALIDIPDDLLTNDDAAVAPLASRTTDVIIMFDVDAAKKEVVVNGEIVPMGVSRLQVNAGMVVGITEDGLKHDPEELARAFDVGIVDIQVFAHARQAVIEGVELTQIIIAERIVEINGIQVEQTELLQQLIEISPAGEISRSAPCGATAATKALLASGASADSADAASLAAAAVDDAVHPAAYNTKAEGRGRAHSSFRTRAADWYAAAPSWLRIPLALLLGAVIGVAALVLMHGLTTLVKSFLIAGAGFSAVPTSEASFFSVPFVGSQVDEKKTLMNHDEEKESNAPDSPPSPTFPQ